MVLWNIFESMADLTSPIAECGYYSRKMKPCKYSILFLKVTGVFSSHLLLFSE